MNTKEAIIIKKSQLIFQSRLVKREIKPILLGQYHLLDRCEVGSIISGSFNSIHINT